jgi:hypothetical protein
MAVDGPISAPLGTLEVASMAAGPWISHTNESLTTGRSPAQRSADSLSTPVENRNGSLSANIELTESSHRASFHSSGNLGCPVDESPRPFTTAARSLESVQLESVHIDQMFQMYVISSLSTIKLIDA